VGNLWLAVVVHKPSVCQVQFRAIAIAAVAVVVAQEFLERRVAAVFAMTVTFSAASVVTDMVVASRNAIVVLVANYLAEDAPQAAIH